MLDIFIFAVKLAFFVVVFGLVLFLFILAAMAAVYAVQCCVERFSEWRTNRGK